MADAPPVTVELVRSRRRSLELRVFPDGRVQVRAPLRCARRDIDTFLASRQDWLQQQLLQLADRPAPRTLSWQEGEAHLLLGRRVPLCFQTASRPQVTLSAHGLTVAAPTHSADRVQGQVQRWYRAQAGVLFNELIDRHMPWFSERGHARPRLTIRDMKSRWGSLSPRGGMSLNLQLIKVGVPLIEYVVVHELCHLEHANHGAGFKALMDEHMPDWRTRRRALNDAELT